MARAAVTASRLTAHKAAFESDVAEVEAEAVVAWVQAQVMPMAGRHPDKPSFPGSFPPTSVRAAF
jgi:hypothetical protein